VKRWGNGALVKLDEALVKVHAVLTCAWRPALAALLSLLLLGAALPESLAGELAAPAQVGAKLTGAEASGVSRFGRSVALSADGDTALVGGPSDGGEIGAAWVFTRAGATWTQQGAKLTGAGESGEGHFGRSVALSADGDTALVGAPNDSGGLGAVWVFTRSGSTWTQQAELTGAGESGKGWFGRSVALSADGDTALVGGYVDHGDAGAVWAFTRSGTTWTQGEKLTGGAEESGAGEFGFGVALSADGETALIGAREDDGGVGAAWVFARAGATWVQQGAKLTGGEEGGEGFFGGSVALSADGETALIGGMKEEGEIGAAWVFARAGGMWVQQGAKLAGGEEVGRGQFGFSVALSSDGETALIGGLGDDGKTGAAWVFDVPPWPPGSEDPAGSKTPAGGEPTPGGATPPSTQTQSPAAGPLAASASAKQGVEAYKAASGGVALVSRRVLVRDGRARVKLRCTAPVACRGRITLSLGVRAKAARRSKTVTIARAGFSILPGGTATVQLKLAPAGRSRLHAGRGYLGAILAIRVMTPDPPGARTYAVKLVSQTPRRSKK
jgi:hypothetical protein